MAWCAGATWPTRPATCPASGSSSTASPRPASAEQRRHALGAVGEDRLEVAAHDRAVGQGPQHAEAQRVAPRVANQGAPVVERRELVGVVPQPVGPAHLDVDEAPRRLPYL